MAMTVALLAVVWISVAADPDTAGNAKCVRNMKCSQCLWECPGSAVEDSFVPSVCAGCPPDSSADPLDIVAQGVPGVVVTGPVYPPEPDMTKGDAPSLYSVTVEFRIPWAGGIYSRTLGQPIEDPLSPEAIALCQGWQRRIRVSIPKVYASSPTTSPLAPRAKVQVVLDGDLLCGTTGQLWETLQNGFHNRHKKGLMPPLVIVCVDGGKAIPDASYDVSEAVRHFENEVMSNRTAVFLQEEVLPQVKSTVQAVLWPDFSDFDFSSDPMDRSVAGCSSSGAGAFIAGWFSPEHFGRIVSFSPTLINVKQSKDFPYGAWMLHSDSPAHHGSLIATSPKKDLRIYHQAGAQDISSPWWYGSQAPRMFTPSQWDRFNLILANNRSAYELTRRGYDTLYEYSLQQGHCGVLGGPSEMSAFTWVWQDGRSCQGVAGHLRAACHVARSGGQKRSDCPFCEQVLANYEQPLPQSETSLLGIFGMVIAVGITGGVLGACGHHRKRAAALGNGIQDVIQTDGYQSTPNEMF